MYNHIAAGGVDANADTECSVDVPEEHVDQFAKFIAICSPEERDRKEAASAEKDPRKTEENHEEEQEGKKTEGTVTPGIYSNNVPYYDKNPSSYPAVGQFQDKEVQYCPSLDNIGFHAKDRKLSNSKMTTLQIMLWIPSHCNYVFPVVSCG